MVFTHPLGVSVENGTLLSMRRLSLLFYCQSCFSSMFWPASKNVRPHRAVDSPPGISGLLWQFQAFGIWWILITSLHNSGLSDFFQSTAMKKRRSYSPCDLVFGSQFILMLAIQLYTVYASFWLFFPAHLDFFIWISWLFNSSFFFSHCLTMFSQRQAFGLSGFLLPFSRYLRFFSLELIGPLFFFSDVCCSFRVIIASAWFLYTCLSTHAQCNVILYCSTLTFFFFLNFISSLFVVLHA